jgi:hypothetical protein
LLQARLALDVGGLAPADPALDCSRPGTSSTPSHGGLCAALHCDDGEWARGQAWALEQAMGAVWHYIDSNPAMSTPGQRTVQRVLADPV